MRRRIISRAAAPIAAAMSVQTQRAAARPGPERFSVVTRGSGPDVILIPGLASDRAVWEDLAGRLEDRFRLHLVRIKGFAGEPAGPNAEGEAVIAPFVEDLARWIEAQGLARPALIGHSLGATAALMLAIRRPELPGRVMVVDMVPFLALLVAGPEATPQNVRPMADALAAEMIAASADAFERREQAMIEGYAWSEAARAGLLQAALASDRVVVAHALRELIVTDLRPELSRVGAPVTVVYAWSPEMGSTPEEADRAYRHSFKDLKDARFVRIDEARHFVMLDQPERFAAATEAFLTGG